MDKWDKRFIELLGPISSWSSCIRAQDRKMAAIIVRDRRIVTTGYNGAPSGVRSCAERGVCMKRKLGIPSGQMQEACFAVHSEQNAIIQAAKLGVSIQGATIYSTHQPCSICAKMIINAGIARVVYCNPYPDEFTLELFAEAGITVEQYIL